MFNNLSRAAKLGGGAAVSAVGLTAGTFAEHGNVISALDIVVIHPKKQWLSSSHARLSARVG